MSFRPLLLHNRVKLGQFQSNTVIIRSYFGFALRFFSIISAQNYTMNKASVKILLRGLNEVFQLTFKWLDADLDSEVVHRLLISRPVTFAITLWRILDRILNSLCHGNTWARLMASSANIITEFNVKFNRIPLTMFRASNTLDKCLVIQYSIPRRLKSVWRSQTRVSAH